MRRPLPARTFPAARCAGRAARSALALLAACVLAACEGLPVVPADIQASRPGVGTVVGAKGPLSPAQSRAVVERASRAASDAGGSSDIVSRHLAVEAEVTGTPLTAGNAVTLLQDGPATYAAMFAAIDSARDHINVETYIFDNDETGQRFATALLAKQAQGETEKAVGDSKKAVRAATLTATSTALTVALSLVPMTSNAVTAMPMNTAGRLMTPPA